ncbi:MAG: hypothetical protein H6585_07645 [Flavobacteriales bacterium]|nr:hypothetical protein [Flavobacteriales bacterium]MCB9448199.1 hypothetical protein [Flavobacteriales bacterium]
MTWTANPMNTSLKWLVLAVGIGIAGCGTSGNESPDQPPSKVVEKEDSSYILIADAQEIMPDWSKDNVVVYHILGDPDNLHPTNGNSGIRTFVQDFTERYLLASDPKHLTLRPDLAAAMPEISADELLYSYTLREGVTFDDGTPLTADDVIFSLKASKCPLVHNPSAKPYVENLKTIEKDPSDPLKFTMVMKKKYVQNMAFLTDFCIVEEHYFDPNHVLRNYSFEQMDDPGFKADDQADLVAWANEYNDPKYGNDPKYLKGRLGLYELESWDMGQSLTLVRKPNHWTQHLANPTVYDVAYPEKIILRINRDANAQLLDFKSQVLDGSGMLSANTLMTLEKDPNFVRNYNSRYTDTYNYCFVALNMRPDGVHRQKLLTDKRVRRAVALLTPTDDILQLIALGKSKRVSGPVVPIHSECNKNLKPLPHDVAEAKRLLDEAGWVDTDNDNIRDKVIDGRKVQFVADLHFMTTQVEWKDMATMIQQGLYEAGLKVNLVALNVNTLYERAEDHDFDMMLAAWSGSAAPIDYKQTWHTASWGNNGSNYTGFGTPESDALVDSIRYIINDSIRIPLAKQLQEIIYDEQPYVFLYASTRRNVIHKRFGNACMYFEKPGISLNALKLLTANGGMALRSATVE